VALRLKFIVIDKDIHLVIEHLGLSRLCLWDQRLIQDIKNILADFLEFSLDLLTVITDGRNVLVGTLRLFLLLDRRDYAPGRFLSSTVSSPPNCVTRS